MTGRLWVQIPLKPDSVFFGLILQLLHNCGYPIFHSCGLPMTTLQSNANEICDISAKFERYLVRYFGTSFVVLVIARFRSVTSEISF